MGRRRQDRVGIRALFPVELVHLLVLVLPRHADERDLDNLTLLLRGKVRRSALAVLVNPSEIPEAGVPRFNNLSPISYALAKADAEGLPWVVMVHGDRLRLYPSSVGVGVGRHGRTETYVEVQTSVLSDEHLGYLWLLFSADALDPVNIAARRPERPPRPPRASLRARAAICGGSFPSPCPWRVRR